MSLSVTTEVPSTSDGATSVAEDRLVIVPLMVEPERWRSASTAGPTAVPSARIVRTDP